MHVKESYSGDELKEQLAPDLDYGENLLVDEGNCIDISPTKTTKTVRLCDVPALTSHKDNLMHERDWWGESPPIATYVESALAVTRRVPCTTYARCALRRPDIDGPRLAVPGFLFKLPDHINDKDAQTSNVKNAVLNEFSNVEQRQVNTHNTDQITAVTMHENASTDEETIERPELEQ
jgi:hypothetical protein